MFVAVNQIVIFIFFGYTYTIENDIKKRTTGKNKLIQFIWRYNAVTFK